MSVEVRRTFLGKIPLGEWKEVERGGVVFSDFNKIKRNGGMLTLFGPFGRQTLTFALHEVENLNKLIRKGILPVQFRVVLPSTRQGKFQ